MVLRVVLAGLLLTASTVHASSCGDSGIPYSFEVLPDGQPVLGCARPSCFGWQPNGQPATSNFGSFYQVNRRPDGFFRQDRATVSPYGPNDPRSLTPQTAICDREYSSSSCASITQWVGGVAPIQNVSTYAMTLQCCSYDVLARSEDRGVAVVVGGQIVVGGEVQSATGQQFAFDYIADIAKQLKPDGSVYYEVNVRRMPCAAAPEDSGRKGAQSLDAQHRAFQAPIAGGGSHGSHGSGSGSGSFESGESGEQAQQPAQSQVIEEVIVQEGVQLPPGSQVQQGPPPPPPFQGQAPPFQGQAAPPPFQGQNVPPPFQQPIAPQQQPVFVQQPPPAFAQQAPVFNQPVAAQPYYPGGYGSGGYGGAGYGAGGGGGGGYYQMCFSADQEAFLKDGTTKRMDELKAGDWVLSMDGHEISYTKVSFWLHRVPSKEAEFHHFELENGKNIKITSHHYIFKGKCSHAGRRIPTVMTARVAVFAEDVHVGDCLYTVSEDRKYMEESRVVRSSLVREKGIYSPMTESGRLIVNGIHSSCHSIVHSNDVQTTFFSYVDGIRQWYTEVFGISNGIDETPFGLSTLIEMVEFVVPKGAFGYV